MLTIKKHQTFFDVVTQHVGTMEAVFDLAKINDKSITDEPIAGNTLTPIDVVNKRVALAFVNNEINIATDYTKNNAIVVQGGIGFMQIGTNFKIS